MQRTSSFNNGTTHVFVNDHDFVRSHGKSPRGRGYWALAVTFSFTDRTPSETEILWAPNDSTVTEAYKWVKKEAKAKAKGMSNHVSTINITLMG